jgi:hypothetical protein
MIGAKRKGSLGFLAVLGFGLALLGAPGRAEAALTVAQTKAFSFGICEKITGLVVVIQPISGTQSNLCGAQNAGIMQISGGTANQTVTLTLPTSRTLRQTGFPNITMSTFTFSTSAGQTFPTRTGTFNLDATGKMTIYVGATAQAQPAGAGTTYAATATVSVL